MARSQVLSKNAGIGDCIWRCGKKAFHEFVLYGNEEALEKFYNDKHQSPGAVKPVFCWQPR